MSNYLLFIGTMNALGVLTLIAALNERFADMLLRQWCRILPQDVPYTHSEYGRLWLWWAIVGTGFFAAINFAAAGWPVEYARFICYGNIYAYFSFELLAIAGSLSPRFGNGVHVCHVLWIAQGGWGIYALFHP